MSEENKNNPEIPEERPARADFAAEEINNTEESLECPNANEREDECGECGDRDESFVNARTEEALDALLAPDGQDEQPSRKRRVNLSTLVCVCVAFCLAAVMLTYTVCNSIYKVKLAEAALGNSSTGEPSDTSVYSSLAILDEIFRAYTFEDLDSEQIETMLLKAYTYATGDRYAAFYTMEEYAELMSSMQGNSEGIGVKVIETSINVGGTEYIVMKIVDVVKDSPASRAGIRAGDCVVAIGTEAENETINVIGYDMALSKLRGAKGTLAEFAVYRPVDNDYELKFFSIMRDTYIDESVTYAKVGTDVDPEGKTGIIKINSFNATTPTQFEAAIEALKNSGCDKFVFDVRGNPGGELTSICAVLSFFFEEGTLLITTKDNAGNQSSTHVAVVEDNPDAGYDCPVAKEDIGKYKDLNCVVLCDGGTASAAELFVACFRDYDQAPVIGTTTFGKGTVQRNVNLAYYGIAGVLKMTMFKYFPPCGEGYDGFGIEPDHTAELSEEAMGFNYYEIFGTSIDNQLMEAVKYFK